MRGAACLVLALLLAGCSDDADVQQGDGADAQQRAAEPGVARWQNTTYSGTFGGVDGGAIGMNPLAFLGEGYGSHSFTVEDGADVLEVAVRLASPVPGQEVLVRPNGPQCAPCNPAKTSGGQAAIDIEQPEGGRWTVALFQDDTGVGYAEYTIHVGVRFTEPAQ